MDFELFQKYLKPKELLSQGGGRRAKNISNFTKEIKKSDFKILNAPVLFVNWAALNEKRCPYCHNKLKLNMAGTIYRCNGAKHKKKAFAIKADNPSLQ